MDWLINIDLQRVTGAAPFNIYIVAFVTIIIAMFASVYNSTRRNKQLVAPPEAGGGWPIIGHLHIFMFGGGVPPQVALGSMADKYGPVFSIQMGITNKKGVVVSSLDSVKECFTTNDKVISDRPMIKALKLMFYGEYSLNHAHYGTYWREFRKISILKLLSNHQVEMISHIRNLEVSEWFNDLYSTTSTSSTSSTALVPDIGLWFSNMTFGVFATIVFGKEKHYLKPACNDIDVDKEAAAAAPLIASSASASLDDHNHQKKDLLFVERFKKVVNESLQIMATSFVVSDIIPCLGWLDRLRGIDKAMKQKGKDLDSILGSWIEERRRHLRVLQSGSDHHQIINNYNDHDHDHDHDHGSSQVAPEEKSKKVFVDHLLSMIEETSYQTHDHHQFFGHDFETFVRSFCMDMIVGGSAAISASLIWILSYLLNNRHVLKKAQEELDANIGKERQVEDSDTGKLVYLQAAIKEAMRLHPSVPIIQRTTVEDCEIGGFHVQAGTRVLLNIWKVQRDPNVWSDPLEFRPERFLDDNNNNAAAANVDLRGQHFQFIPFGAGRRICPAVTFSLRLMNLILARLIHSFDMRTPMDAMVDMTASTVAFTEKATPIQVLITPRLNSKVYS